MKTIKKIGKAFGRAIILSAKFCWFIFTLWMTVFAGIILWSALPSVLLLRIATEILVGCAFYICWTGLPKFGKKHEEE